MTIQEFDKKYYLHDSMIKNIRYSPDLQKLEILLDFCYWAQEWYVEGEPELMEAILTFEGIDDYTGITGDIDYFSILDGDIEDNKYHLYFEDEFNQESYEYYFSPSNVEFVIVRPIDD